VGAYNATTHAIAGFIGARSLGKGWKRGGREKGRVIEGRGGKEEKGWRGGEGREGDLLHGFRRDRRPL